LTAQAQAGDENDVGGDSEKERVDVLFGGDYFGAGASAGPGASVEGDAFIAGGEVILNRPVDGDAVLSGGSIHVGERIGSDLYAAGGDILVNARVGHNARLAGGRVHLTRHADVGGRVTIAGSRIRVDGSTGGALAVYGDSVVLDGEIGDAVAVVARNLELGPNTRIHGRLTYRTANEPQISERAIIDGGVQRSGFEFPDKELEPVARTVVWVGVAMFTSGLFLVGVLILLLAPNALTSVVGGLRSQPLGSFLLGFALIVCVPVAAVLATLSVIGIPLGLVLLFIWPVIVTLGYLTGVIFCADALAGLVSRRRPAGRALRILGLAVTLTALMLLSRVVFVGVPLILLLLFLGTGALVLAIRNAVR
jgi:hypothetical protein